MQDKPQKKPVRRRVRVIEVLDEGDDENSLRDLLDNLDGIDRATGDSEPETVPTPDPDPEPASRESEAASREPEAASREPEAGLREPEAGLREPEAGSRELDVASREPEAGLREPEAERQSSEISRQTGLRRFAPGSPAFVAALVAVVVLVTGSLTATLYFWRQYDRLDSARADRRAVAARATAYGNQMATYSTADIKGSQDRIRAFLTGDALSQFQGSGGAPANTSGKQIATRSRVDQVLVTDVNGKLATAVVIWHLDMSSSGGQGTTVGSNLGILLDMAKVRGRWMVAHQQPLTSHLTGSGPSGTAPSR
jgi:hypothetical protein